MLIVFPRFYLHQYEHCAKTSQEYGSHYNLSTRLRELTWMVQCTCQSTGKEILPIFYDVDPLDVKFETNLYKSVLRTLEEDLGCAEVKPWKEALTTVARIKGWHIKDQRY